MLEADFENLVGRLKLHAVAFPLSRLSRGADDAGAGAVEAAVDELKKNFDLLFPAPPSASKKVRTKRAGVPDELVAILKALAASYPSDDAKRARLLDLYAPLAFADFQERFAAFLSKFKAALPAPILEIVEQDVLRGAYKPGAAAGAPAAAAAGAAGAAAAAAAAAPNGAAAQSPKSPKSPKRRGKRAAASQEPAAAAAEADNAAPKQAAPRRADLQTDDAPPTPPRGKSVV